MTDELQASKLYCSLVLNVFEDGSSHISWPNGIDAKKIIPAIGELYVVVNRILNDENSAK